MSEPAPAGITPRQELILRVVVEDHIATGAPVGSKHIAGREGLDFSSSTVRYELAALEEMGYLDHPHTSAGRVPTGRGYRRYVDTFLSSTRPAPPALRRTLSGLELRREIDDALRDLAETLARVTNLLGVVTAPAPEAATIRHVEVLRLQPRLVMVVVITSTGEVARRMFEFGSEVDPGLTEWAGAFLNERVQGLAVGARMISSRLAEPTLSGPERAFLDALTPAVADLAHQGETVLYVGGRAHLLGSDMGLDLDLVDGLMRRIEERYALLALLREALQRHEVYLRIGDELSDPELQGMAMVAANYGVARRNLGTVSLLGPLRMDYRMAVAAVREASRLLSEHVESMYE